MRRKVYLTDAVWMTPRFPDGDIDQMCGGSGMPCLSHKAQRRFDGAIYEEWRHKYRLPSQVRDLALACEVASRLRDANNEMLKLSKLHLVFAVQESELLEHLIILDGKADSAANWGNPQNAGEVLAELLGAQTFASINAACATGNYAIGMARDAISSGDVDCVAVIVAFSLFHCADQAFQRMDLAAEFCMPCHPARSGTVVSEGAAALIVASEAPKPCVEIAGCGFSADAYNQVALDPQGIWIEAAMRDALRMAKLSPSEIDYVNLHGTGTIANDRIELDALHRLEKMNAIMGSTKAYVGHCLMAASGVEAALCRQFLMAQRVPKDTYLRDHAKQVAWPRFHTDKLSNAPIQVMMSNSFGFGGANSSVIFARTE